MIDMETKLQHSTNVHSEHVAPPDAKPMLCAVCNSDELPLSELEGYEGLCLGCECNKMNEKLEEKWSKELAIYEKRTGQKLDFNEFYNECEKGNVDKANLKRLPELKSCYEDAMMNIAFYEQEYWQGQELELKFYGVTYLPL